MRFEDILVAVQAWDQERKAPLISWEETDEYGGPCTKSVGGKYKAPFFALLTTPTALRLFYRLSKLKRSPTIVNITQQEWQHQYVSFSSIREHCLLTFEWVNDVELLQLSYGSSCIVDAAAAVVQTLLQRVSMRVQEPSCKRKATTKFAVRRSPRLASMWK